jgi:hypothetical protein
MSVGLRISSPKIKKGYAGESLTVLIARALHRSPPTPDDERHIVYRLTTCCAGTFVSVPPASSCQYSLFSFGGAWASSPGTSWQTIER